MKDSTLERKYERELIDHLNERYPGCVIRKNDPSRDQGIPDLTIYIGDWWGMLEVKASKNSPQQPNQDYWVDYYNTMSFAAFIYPENEEQVLNELQRSLESSRSARVTQS